MYKILLFICLSLSMYVCHAQQTEAEKYITKLMEVNGSAATYDLVFDQIVAQYRIMKPDVAQAVWDLAKKVGFDKEIGYLKKDLIPVYAKKITPEEVKQLIAFYTSTLGQKLVEGTTKISKESMKIAQTWGCVAGRKNTRLLG